MPLCGSAPDDGEGRLGLCYQGLIYLGIPTLVAVLGFCYAHLQEGKLRRMRTLFSLRTVVRFVQVIDWVRVVAFLGTGLAPLGFYLYEDKKWVVYGQEDNGGMPPYLVIEIVVYGILVWSVLGVSWLFHEVRRGSAEWAWLRLFTFLSTIGEVLCLWSAVANVETDYPDSPSHQEFAVVRAVTLVVLKAWSMFLMVCFSRDWRSLRRDLRAYSSTTRENLIAVRDESFMEASDLNDLEQPPRRLDDDGYDDDDDLSSSKLERTPEQYAGLLSRLTFTWMETVMRKGASRELESSDFYRLLRQDEPQTVARRFNKQFRIVKEEEDREEAAKAVVGRGARVAAARSSQGVGAATDYTILEEEEEQEVGNENTKAKQSPPPEGHLRIVVKALHRAGILTDFYQAAFFKWMYDSLMFVSPQLLKRLINVLEDKDLPTSELHSKGLMYASIMFGCALLQTFVLHVYFHKAFRTGMNVRTSLLTSIYAKSLRLTPSAKQQRSTGQVVNLMSTDCERLNGLFPYLHVTWSSPYQVALSIYFLWSELHYAVLVSLSVVLFVLIPTSAFVAKNVQSVQKRLMKVKDVRIRAAGEAVNSIKVIKMYGWEREFRKRVEEVREDELALLRVYLIWNACSRTLWNATPVIVTLVTFAAYVALGGVLDASRAFTALSLLNILRFPLMALPNIINAAAEAAVSLRRISGFLESEELDLQALEQARKNTERPAGSAIFVRDGKFFWDDKERQIALRDINLDIKEGSFAVITGAVGSGKSAMLGMLIGELQPKSYDGSAPPVQLSVGGSVALAAQVPWIQNETVRDNILFGQPYEREWYNRVIQCCSLEADLKQLAEGDATEIGERGINLSGGQKARVSLARAVYSRADVVLLESCFEAVDEHVSAFLARNCFEGILKEPNPITGRRRTVVLVTHALKYVQSADQVAVMKGGKIVEQGRMAPLLAQRNSELAKLARMKDENEGESEKDAIGSPKASKKELVRKLSSFRAGGSQKPAEGAGKLVDKEKREVGQVKSRVYRAYFEAVGGMRVVLTVVAGLTIRTLLDSGTSAWLAYWSSQNKKQAGAFSRRVLFPDDQSYAMFSALQADGTVANSTTFAQLDGDGQWEEPFWGEGEDPAPKHSTGFFLGVYAALSFGSVLFVGSLTLYYAMASLTAARAMHTRMFTSVLRAPMAFFDTTPVGRILNRFSKDQYSIDETLPNSMYSFLSTVFSVLGTVGTIAAVTPIFLALLPFLALVYARIQRYYIATSRQIKRWDSVLRSPIYSHFSESLDGATTVRAYGAVRRFVKHNLGQLDSQLSAYYISISVNRWLAVRLETIGSLLVLFTSLFVVFFLGGIDAAFGALAISFSLNITQTLNWTVRMSADIENNIVSVERVNEYIEVEPEAPEDTPDPSRVPAENAAWPTEGRIQFQGVSARYRPELDLVLKDVGFEIAPGEKVGIVGRTGSGKSSTLLVLLRIIECSHGRVLIDGYDAHDFGLERLRSSIAIIPQDPVLFTASLRDNLDPTHSFSDREIWKALEMSHLKEHVQSLVQDQEGINDPLDFMMAEGGSNFSFGQGQLLCIARAILRKCKIVLLDEATSQIDNHTDNLIQDTIRSEFSEVTMLTIAHRLDTIADSDKILVIDFGEIAEFNTPEALKADPNSLYSKLLQQQRDAEKEAKKR